MKKVQKLGIVLLGLCLLAGCFFKPQITKEQQDNIAIQIYRNYDIQEIEFLSFTKNESTGSYRLEVKINNDEDKITRILIADINTLDKKTGGIGLNPVNRFEDIERSEPLTENVSASEIKIKYIGEK
ncbi:hypothetical protein [Granulicatella adiacens]|uniref:hypothetical protein n=1 Tax=Granulicatella adiacens TaxID=46124 RepID=UPI0021A29034|nr:hypothetical protein [Granulicatella adiacens]MCT2161298.1 hypothetical protein [Granulicatella adiacens]